MLTRFGDFPLHQLPVPVAQTGTTDRNRCDRCDRYVFNGHSMTLHPSDCALHEITFHVLDTDVRRQRLPPEWAPGTGKGELAVGGDEWKLADVDPMAPHDLHIQSRRRVTLDGTPGCGFLEQSAIGAQRADRPPRPVRGMTPAPR